MITVEDLQKFCGTDLLRENIHHPWSRGEFTYATNGHIIIRVDRMPLVPENDEAPDAEKKVIPSFASQIATEQIPEFEISDEKEECEYCSGHRFKHECDDCSHECELCDGTGFAIPSISIGLFGAKFNARYIKKISRLPGVKFAKAPDNAGPFKFEFDGGIGALMPLINHYFRKIELP